MTSFYSARWALYRAAEMLTARSPRRHTPRPFPLNPPAMAIFATTIGELNAIAPFLRALQPAPELLLLSDRPIYHDAFLRAWPGAQFVAVDAHSHTAAEFFHTQKISLFVIAEIPLLLHDAPARLPYAWLHHAKQSGVPVALINGWLYDEQPACRMDRLERGLFARDYLRHIDLITVQDERTRSTLIARGANPANTHVVGNLKFDATAHTPGPPLIDASAVIVAGSVNDVQEINITLDAFVQVRRVRPECRLIIAPRHPEDIARTDRLCAKIAQRRLRYALRSQQPGIAPHVDCLVLDTFGELKDAYAHAACAHVGINHNVLEPLMHGRAVTVCRGWQQRYPSYGVYRMLANRGVIHEVLNSEVLAARWLDALDAPPREREAALKPWRGATERTLALWRRAGWV